MGYSTEFSGQIDITPRLDADEMKYLYKFSRTRRMIREKGPYFVDGSGFAGQGNDPDIIDHNTPPPGQPGLWCQWVPNNEGTALVWDQGEKFYDAQYWMLYLIQHFLRADALAIPFVPQIRGGHILEGKIYAQGDDLDDKWTLTVKRNDVFTREQGLGTEKITPSDYMFPLSNDRFRAYFQNVFKTTPHPSWTQAIVYVDPATGALTKLMRVFVQNREVAVFTIDESGQAHRVGMLEWEPPEED